MSGLPDFPPALRDAILDWYVSRARSLPFRGSTDPYAILVSEAMAQQTQAARAGDAWTRFMDRFPTVEALAAATPADVLRAWQGLGYNRRALNLWRAARRIVDEFGGRVPADLADLESLPGVGPYTARAVAALAFGLPVGAVDTNVRRVLGRIVAGEVGHPEPGRDAATGGRGGARGPGGRLDPCRDGRGRDRVPAARAGLRGVSGAAVVSICRRHADADDAARRPGRGLPERRAAPFPTTSRWLRGRILDRLRDARDGEWVVFDSSIGAHDAESVHQALTALAMEGLVERDVGQSFVVRARLPLA